MEFEEYLEQQKKLNDFTKLMVKHATIKDCSHPDKTECRLPIKSAHSLQRQGPLKILEKNLSGNAFIYSHVDREINKKYGFLDLKPIGRKDASTFFGFCDFHDTELFKVIENDPETTDINNNEHCFLHTYRSFSHSYHRKYEEHKLFTSEEKDAQSYLERVYSKESIDEIVQGVKLALKDFEKPKNRIDALLLKKEYDGLYYSCYEYPYTSPVSCSGVSSPEYYKNGSIFNLSSDKNFEYSNVFTTVLPMKNRTIVILSCLVDDDRAIKYLAEFENIKHELEFQKYLSFHIMNNLENVYVSPYFFDKKTLEWRQSYCQTINLISDKKTPFVRFNKFFPINYFSKSDAIKL